MTANSQSQTNVSIIFDVSKYGTASDSDEHPGSVRDGVWEEMGVSAKRQTSYELVRREGGGHAIKAVSSAAASGLIYITKFDPNEYPVIEWSWKIEGVLDKGDLAKKRGDDYAARIYITFEYEKSRLSFGEKVKLWFLETFTSYDIPLRALNYIWANKAPRGTIAPNPFTKWVQMVAVQSGGGQAGQWLTERRNIVEDYIAAFGEEPGRITGVAIMTDTDNTGESATAYYGDIIFREKVP